MPSKFRAGAAAYSKDGRRYVVEAVDDGLVYCSSDGGGEAEFSEAQLQTEAEWATRAGGRKEILYGRVKQAYAPYRGPLKRADSEQLLASAERVAPGILDFTAFAVACRVMDETDNRDFVAELSIVRCRAIFDAAAPEVRADLLARLLGAAPDRLVSAGRVGDNLVSAMIQKGLEAHRAAFEEFGARPRR